MRVWKRVAVLAAVIAASTGVGVAAALEVAQPGDDPGIDASAGPVANDTGGAAGTESKYVAVRPCRIVDTRKAGGTIGNNVARTFDVAGTSGFTDQGGSPGGCGIPDGASAVELSLTIVSASGGGFMRVYPGGTSEPNATFINYSPYNPTNTGTVTLCSTGCGGGDLSVRGHGTGTTTHVVIEVQGYYAKPLAAVIDGDGDPIVTSRLVSTERVGAGVYYLTFDRGINQCIGLAAPFYNDQYIAAVQTDTNNRVLVVVKSEATGSNQDGRFQIEVVC